MLQKNPSLQSGCLQGRDPSSTRSGSQADTLVRGLIVHNGEGSVPFVVQGHLRLGGSRQVFQLPASLWSLPSSQTSKPMNLSSGFLVPFKGSSGFASLSQKSDLTLPTAPPATGLDGRILQVGGLSPAGRKRQWGFFPTEGIQTRLVSFPNICTGKSRIAPAQIIKFWQVKFSSLGAGTLCFLPRQC